MVHRTYPENPEWDGATIESPSGLGDDEEQIEAAIAAEVDFFTGRGQAFEWKTYADDEPADLVDRLVRHGFEAGDVEVVMLGEAADPVDDIAAPEGVRIREFAGEDWERVRVLMDGVWGTASSWVNDALRAEQERDPALLRPVPAGGDWRGLQRVISYAALGSRRVWTSPACGVGQRMRSGAGGLYRAPHGIPGNAWPRRRTPYVRGGTPPDSRPILTPARPAPNDDDDPVRPRPKGIIPVRGRPAIGHEWPPPVHPVSVDDSGTSPSRRDPRTWRHRRDGEPRGAGPAAHPWPVI